MRSPLAHLALRLCLIAADAALRALAAAPAPAAACLAAWVPFPAFLEPREPPARTAPSPALPELASESPPPPGRLLPTAPAPAPEESDLAPAPPSSSSCGLADSLASDPEPLSLGNRTCAAPGPAAAATAAAAPRPPPKVAATAGGRRPASSIALHLLHARRLGAARLAAGAAAAAWTCAAMLGGWGA
jgi:hypothetical protein